jgi:hypothetical protein
MKIESIDNRFIPYKNTTINLVKTHSIRHPNCILEHLNIDMMSIQSVNIYNTRYEPMQLAYCFPDKMDSIIYVRRNYNWSERKAVVTIIHESLHMRFICSPDNVRSNVPLCNLWGFNAFESQDISILIEGHLDKELKELNK